MQLNDILEENSVKAISAKTKISEDNLENLLAKNFDKLKKVKTLGFISIIEREYNADLANLREEGYEYYAQLSEDKSITLGLPINEEKKGSSKFFMFFILLLFAVATWYFLTQFDKKNLRELIPFIDEATIESFVGSDIEKNEIVKDLSVAKVIDEVKANTIEKVNDTPDTVKSVSEQDAVTEDEGVVVTQSVTDITPKGIEREDDFSADKEVKSVDKVLSIVPVDRLWFGVIDIETKERDHFSISNTYELDVSSTRWLLATSSAPFSLKVGKKEETFNDAKEHYFKIDNSGVTVLSKSEYIALGGWAQW